MNIITWLKSYLDEVVTDIEGINRQKMVIDSSQLSKYLESHSSDFNNLLIGVLPDLNSKGDSAETFEQVAVCQFMILEKTGYSDINYDEFFAIFEKSYSQAQLVIKKMLDQQMRGCTVLRKLDVSSIKIVPVWNLSSCNGCNILFSFDTSL
ncbi:hypothetical protein [Sediminibacter sp. Hel_I_10]|uniref:hypothetical protein n=1 Tax=Sediminibacter sp. Hel_I_10 TaxID=1392490 RepID=UPI00047888F7|nr:hypothetical protein [Sediminibacter sp. Hel_I_10]